MNSPFPLKMTFKLAWIFLRQTVIPSSLTGNSKNGASKKSIVAYILALLYCVGVFGFMFVSTMITLYGTLKGNGLQSLLPLLIGFAAFFATFFFGFMSASSSYVSGEGDEYMHSLPLKPAQFFVAKFLSVYATESILSLGIILIGGGIFGAFEGLLTNPIFYLLLIAGALAMPALSLGLCYLLLVVLLNIFRRLKNKNLLMTLATLFMVAFLMVFNVFYQKMINSVSQQMLLIETLSSSASSGLVSTLFFPMKLLYSGIGTLGKNNGMAFLAALGLVACIAAIVLVIIPALSPLYMRSALGFNEVTSKKLKTEESKAYIRQDLKKSSLFQTLLIRDIKAILREPSWFVNGPFMILLLPILMIVSIGVSLSSAIPESSAIFSNLSSIGPVVNAYMAQNGTYVSCIAAFALALFSVFGGTCTNTASTAFSREGKGLSNLIALPIPAEVIFKAKLFHAFLYPLLSILLTDLLLAIAMIVTGIRLSAADAFTVFGLSAWLCLTLSYFINLIEFQIDLSHPKLDWENPTAAFKNNTNSLISILVVMGIVAGIAAGLAFLPKTPLFPALFGTVFALISILWHRNFMRHSQEKLNQLI